MTKIRSTTKRRIRPLTLTWGADPELHIQHIATEKITSAIPILKHSKHDPIDLGGGDRLYYDNVMAEVSMAPSDLDGIVKRFQDVFRKAKKQLGPKYRLFPKAMHEYSADDVNNEIAQTAGCDPSFNVWEGKMNDAPAFKGGLRSASHHIHCGRIDWKESSDERLMSMDSKEEALRLMDVFVGSANILWDKDPTAPQRRALYGRSSESRFPGHGIEYRVCGPYSLSTPELTRLAYDIAGYAMSHIVNDTSKDVLKRINPKDVQSAINDNKPELARKVLMKAGLPDHLMERLEKEYKVPVFEKAWDL